MRDSGSVFKKSLEYIHAHFLSFGTYHLTKDTILSITLFVLGTVLLVSPFIVLSLVAPENRQPHDEDRQEEL